MYYPGQIVWGVDEKKPVNSNTCSGKTSHFINSEGKPVCPKNIKEANLLLKRGRIVQAPIADHLCWSCNFWLDSAPLEKCEATEEHSRCVECKGFDIYGKIIDKMVCQACHEKLSKNALRLVAEELLKEIIQEDKNDSYYPSKISKLIANLVELNECQLTHC